MVHWPLMGGLLHLVQRGGAWAGYGPAQSPHRCTKCNSPPINGQCTITVLLYDGLLLCGFNVAIKGLSPASKAEDLRDGDVKLFVCVANACCWRTYCPLCYWATRTTAIPDVSSPVKTLCCWRVRPHKRARLVLYTRYRLVYVQCRCCGRFEPCAALLTISETFIPGIHTTCYNTLTSRYVQTDCTI